MSSMKPSVGQAQARLLQIEAELLPLLKAAYPSWNIADTGSLYRAHRKGPFRESDEPGTQSFAVTAGSVAELWVLLDVQESLDASDGIVLTKPPTRPRLIVCEASGVAE